MLMNDLKVVVNNLFKESFYEKRKKKVINILTDFFFFFIFHKSGVKTFLKCIINHCSKGNC